MGLNAATAKQFTRPLVVPFDGLGELNIMYRPAAVTVARERAYNEQVARDNEAGKGPLPALVKRVCEVVAEWDLDNDDAKGQTYRVPLKPDALDVIPTVLLLGVLNATIEDQGLNPMRRVSSERGGSQAVPVGARRNGSPPGESESSFQ